jgi:peptidoglycan/LPS O-acetylase OafA/YrhL
MAAKEARILSGSGAERIPTLHRAGTASASRQFRTAEANPFYRPELDCLRFFAFLGVFVHHTIPKDPSFFKAHGLPVMLSNFSYAGAFGVDLFFCLSAYLITELLLREKEQTGHLNVTAFYIRRILRIWPLYFFFVSLAYGMTYFDTSQVFTGRQLLMFLLLAGNWASAVTYLNSVVAPLWSVSVEEQFYLLWPLAVSKASRRQILTICVALIVVAFVWRSLVQQLAAHPHDLIWNGTFSYLDALSYGIILGVVENRRPLSTWTRFGLAALGLSAWFAAASFRTRGDVMLALAAIGSALLLRATVGLRVRSRVLIKLGTVSYGLYVYHELFVLLLSRIVPKPSALGFIAWWFSCLGCTVVAALASYRWLESPFLRLKKRFTIVKSKPV